MSALMPAPKSHLFICTNGPNIAGRCGHKNAEALRQAVKEKWKEKCKNEPWSQQVRINSSGCLGQCEQGIAAVIYPEAKWFLNLTENDDKFLFNALCTSMQNQK